MLTRAAAVEAVAVAWRGGRLLQGYRALYAHDVDVGTGSQAARLGCNQATLFAEPAVLPRIKEARTQLQVPECTRAALLAACCMSTMPTCNNA